jgi:hypothetical protein
MARRVRPRSPLPQVAILALAATAGTIHAGCQFNPGSLSGGDGTPADAMPVPDDGQPQPPDGPQPPDDGAQPPPDGPQPPPDGAQPPPDGPQGPADAAPLPGPNTLVDRGLLTRYFIDEDTDGTDTMTLEDSGPAPTMSLDIDYDGQGSFIDDGGNRGVRWNAITQNGTAEAPLPEDGKVWLGLDGSTTGTIEMVIDVDAFLDGSRLSHIGEGADVGVFTLRIDDPQGLTLTWNNDFNTNRVSWNVDLVAAGRTVLHVVYDSARPTVAERARLYVNGVEQPVDSGTLPGRDETILLPDSAFLYSLGNTEAGNRGVAGTFFYASMYSAALDPAEVAHNFDILVDDDDGPGGGP